MVPQQTAIAAPASGVMLRLAKPLDVSVIVPTINEAENLPRLLRRIRKAMGGIAYEVIIVDDDSSDGTPTVCQQLARQHPLRLVLRHGADDGLGGAVLHGMALARGCILVVMDADLQHPPEAIPYLLSPLRNGEADFVLGSRYVAGGTMAAEHWTLPRRLNSRAAKLLARPIAGRRVRDPMSGLFAMHRQAYIAAARRLTPIGYKIALELICKCRVKRIVEVPIHFAARAAGESKLDAREQLRYLRHVGRLYAFTFRRTTTLIKAALGASAGAGLAALTNPALMWVLAVMSGITLTFVTRPRRPAQLTRRQLLDAERVLRFNELAELERAA
jgi:dolichol-phosphate mannosyltransferase